MSIRITKSLVVLSTTGVLMATTPAFADQLSTEQARAVITPFYSALTVGADKDPQQLIEKVTSKDWVSCNGDQSCAPRASVIKSIQGLGKVIPDLTWEMKDVLVDGSTVIVRGEAQGTPVGNFMGVQNKGKSFKIMSIDIHEIKDGKMHRSYHVEDWMGATRQLSSK